MDGDDIPARAVDPLQYDAPDLDRASATRRDAALADVDSWHVIDGKEDKAGDEAAGSGFGCVVATTPVGAGAAAPEQP